MISKDLTAARAVISKLALALVLAAFCLPAALDAQATQNPSAQNPAAQPADPWAEALQTVGSQVQGGQWREAKSGADELLAQMTHSMRTADGAARHFALATLYRALAHAGLGEKREARWDWQIVFELDPTLAKRAGLEPFGAAGTFLDAYRRDPKTTETATLFVDPPEGDAVTVPRLVDAPQPAFPQSLENKNAPYRVTGRLLVSAGGLPERVTVVSSPGSVFTFAVLNAAKDWTFTPASRGGTMVAMASPFGVDFKRPGAQPAAPAQQ